MDLVLRLDQNPKCGKGEGGSLKSRTFCRRPLWMFPYAVLQGVLKLQGCKKGRSLIRRFLYFMSHITNNNNNNQ